MPIQALARLCRAVARGSGDGLSANRSALLEHGSANPFSRRDVEIAGDAPPITVAEALQLLHMHKHAVRGVGGRPGAVERAPDWEAVRASILRKIERIERSRDAEARRGPAVLAGDAREWARRRTRLP